MDKYAYMQYATNYDYLNLAIINFIHLRKANTKIPNLVVFMMKSYITMLVINGVSCTKWQTNTNHLKAAPLIKASYQDDSNWAASFTKFHIFNQVEYDRIVFLILIQCLLIFQMKLILTIWKADSITLTSCLKFTGIIVCPAPGLLAK